MSLDLNTVDELYHGSPERVPFPDVFFSSANRDFGRGFYLFPNRDDAYDWALINFLPYLEYDRLDYQICLKTKKAERALRFNGADKCY
jgi:hypothetical protein